MTTATRYITAPENQYVIHGRDSTLTCSYDLPGVSNFPTVEKDGATVDNGRITNANLDDEGDYVCDIYLPVREAAIEVPFTVHVIGNVFEFCFFRYWLLKHQSIAQTEIDNHFSTYNPQKRLTLSTLF